MDTLTDVLRMMRLSGGVFLDAAFTAPWSILSKVGPEDCLPFMAEPAQLIAYHCVVEGCLLLSLPGQAPVDATAGHLLVLPRNDLHLLGSALDLQPANADELISVASYSLYIGRATSRAAKRIQDGVDSGSGGAISGRGDRKRQVHVMLTDFQDIGTDSDIDRGASRGIRCRVDPFRCLMAIDEDLADHVLLDIRGLWAG